MVQLHKTYFGDSGFWDTFLESHLKLHMGEVGGLCAWLPVGAHTGPGDSIWESTRPFTNYCLGCGGAVAQSVERSQ